MSQNLHPPPPMADQYGNPPHMPMQAPYPLNIPRQAAYPPPMQAAYPPHMQAVYPPPMQAVNQPNFQYAPVYNQPTGGYPGYPTNAGYAPAYLQQPYPPVILAPPIVFQQQGPMIIRNHHHSGCIHQPVTQKIIKDSAWVWAIILCIISPILFWIPFCMEECYENQSFCRHCQVNS